MSKIFGHLLKSRIISLSNIKKITMSYDLTWKKILSLNLKSHVISELKCFIFLALENNSIFWQWMLL